ncbi:MAG: hypothetical protein JWR12_579 [Mucilaginibacter sp.]|nr:hypothetical protein [Mucilaginibacter sp.]
MIKNFYKNLLAAVFILYLCFGLFSCGSVKDYKYFQDIPDSTRSLNIKLQTYQAPVIEIGNILSVSIFTTDPTAAANVNISGGTSSSSSASSSSPEQAGYALDNDGNIEIPVIGKINVVGLTIQQASSLVKEKALVYFKDPVVIVKLKNFKITVLGEVAKPGTYYVPNDKSTIIDALGLVSDLTPYGNRENILLLRHNGDKSVSTLRLNLKSSSIIKSPYFYLQNNDMIYIEPTKARVIASDAVFSRNLQLISLAASVLAVLVVVLRK